MIGETILGVLGTIIIFSFIGFAIGVTIFCDILFLGLALNNDFWCGVIIWIVTNASIVIAILGWILMVMGI